MRAPPSDRPAPAPSRVASRSRSRARGRWHRLVEVRCAAGQRGPPSGLRRVHVPSARDTERRQYPPPRPFGRTARRLTRHGSLELSRLRTTRVSRPAARSAGGELGLLLPAEQRLRIAEAVLRDLREAPSRCRSLHGWPPPARGRRPAGARAGRADGGRAWRAPRSSSVRRSSACSNTARTAEAVSCERPSAMTRRCSRKPCARSRADSGVAYAMAGSRSAAASTSAGLRPPGIITPGPRPARSCVQLLVRQVDQRRAADGRGGRPHLCGATGELSQRQ